MTEDKGHSRHGHRKALNCDIGIKRLEHITRQKRVVHARVLVLFEVRKLVMAYIDHLDGCNQQSTGEEVMLSKSSIRVASRAVGKA